MKFDKLFPKVEIHKTPYEYITPQEYDILSDDNKFRFAHYMKSESSGQCWICGENTSWIEINFEGFRIPEADLRTSSYGYAQGL